MSEDSVAPTSWRELDDASYTQLRHDLLREKGSDEQRTFLGSLKTGSAFSSLIRDRVQVTQGDDPPILETPLTESEFVKPPPSTEQNLFKTWRSVTPAQASRTTFWGNVTLQNIEARKIEPCFLIASGNPSGGLGRIHEVLQAGSEKQIDDAVRRTLRRFSGLQERGYRSVYSDGTFPRAWWRCYLAHEICDHSQAPFKDIHQVFYGKSGEKGYWEELINTVVSRNAVIGDSNVRSALVWALSELDANDLPDGVPSDVFEIDGIRRMTVAIGIRSAWQELSVFSVPQLKTIMYEEIIRNTR